MFMPLCLDLSYQITYRQAGLTVATSLNNSRGSASQGVSSTGEYTGRLHVNCSPGCGTCSHHMYSPSKRNITEMFC